MKPPPIIVVGGGIGGLCAAIRLAAAGQPVQLFETANSVGGKIRQVNVAGTAMDCGPTVLTMKPVFDELFETANAKFDDYVTTQPLEVLARHAWSDNETLDLYADQDRSIDAIGRFAGSAEAKRFERFCHHTERVFNTLEKAFMKSQRPNPITLVQRCGLRGLPGLFAMQPFLTLWRSLTQQLQHPQLRQLFARYSTYCGSSPYLASAVLMLIAHVEQRGVWSVDGGMLRLAQGCQNLALELGVEFHMNTGVERLVTNSGRISGVITEAGTPHAARAVIFNGDPAAISSGLLGDTVNHTVKKFARHQRSLSAVTFNFRASVSGFNLDRHNVFFSKDYAHEFKQILSDRTLPSDPTIYVCAQDRGLSNQLNSDSQLESLFCLINAPADADTTSISKAQLAQHFTRVLERLSQSGLVIKPDIQTMVPTSPQHFGELFPGSHGALYGQASHHWSSSFSRPKSRTKIDGLYLAGGGAHPGPGVPMAAISGQLAAQQLVEDLCLT